MAHGTPGQRRGLVCTEGEGSSVRAGGESTSCGVVRERALQVCARGSLVHDVQDSRYVLEIFCQGSSGTLLSLMPFSS